MKASTVARPRRDGPAVSSASLSPGLRRLLERIWLMEYGVVRGLHVRSGEPLFEPPPEFIRAVRLTDAPQPRRSSSGSFSLAAEQIALKRELDELGDGVIDVIKVHDGLPVGVEIREPA